MSDTTPGDGTVSIARALSKLGFCSRAEGERLVRAGRVRVAGAVVQDIAHRLNPERARIEVDGAPIAVAAKVHLALNKPRGLVTTRQDPEGRATIYACLAGADLPFVGPVGRLDKASEGLLLLTNDSQWGARITDPASAIEKAYHVQVRGVPDEGLLARLRQGVHDPATGAGHSALRVSILRVGSRSSFWLEVVLDEGKNRQIRRMLAGVGLEVMRLVRVSIGPLALGALAKGEWRHLTEAEVEAFR
ncbi:MAG: rRNA pseudouridine synthase [Gemmatimonadota bacterium]|nr:rRNA pseudouridine synthase [Gemmatimonadota bacterium]